MVEATPRLNPDKGGTIRARGLANGDGSTGEKILFTRSNGFVLLAGANSAAGLRQRTVRYAVEDDLDQFPDDLDGQGSPESMVDARLKVWKSRGLSKRLKISTPTIKGSSKIAAAYGESDRRRYYLKCPHCGSRFLPEWGDIQWPDGKPELAHMVAPCCGVQVDHWQKRLMKLANGWLSAEIVGETVPRVLSEGEFQGWRARMPAPVRISRRCSGRILRISSTIGRIACGPRSMMERPPIFTTCSQGRRRMGRTPATGRVSWPSRSVWLASGEATCLMVLAAGNTSSPRREKEAPVSRSRT